MGRKKLLYFEHNTLANNVLEESKPIYNLIKGKWNETFFKNNNKNVLEIACGKGEFTVGLAKQYPNVNFIGIDMKGDRLAVGSKNAINEGLSNAAFLRTNVFFIENFFGENEVDEIWIVFPDPFNVKSNRENRRLTNVFFLEKYRRILKNGGVLHLKTDSQELFDYSICQLGELKQEEILRTNDFYESEFKNDHFGIQTKFETVFMKRGFSIKYLKTKLFK